jgi:AAHS family benzoate transporter-like MFS transporter
VRSDRRTQIILVLVAVASAFGQFGAVSSLGDVARHFADFHTARSLQSQVGLSTTMLGTGLATLRLASLAALPLSALADRYGRTRVLRRIVTLGLIFTALAAFSPGYWWFVFLFACARPLLSATNSLIQVIVTEISSDRIRVHRLAWLAAGAGGGAGLSAVLHGFVRGDNSFRILFALAMVPVVVLWPLLQQIDETHPHNRDRSLPRLGVVPHELRGRVAILSTLAGVIALVTGPANSFAFVYGERILHISPSRVALVVSSSAILGLGGLLASRWSAHRYGRRRTVLIGTFATAATSTVAYFGGEFLFTAGYLVGVAAAAYLAPAASALTTESFPKAYRATAAGWVVVSGVLGATLGLFAFGAVGDAINVAGQSALRIPSLVTFLPLLPLTFLVMRLPETRGAEIN